MDNKAAGGWEATAVWLSPLDAHIKFSPQLNEENGRPKQSTRYDVLYTKDVAFSNEFLMLTAVEI